MPFEISKSIISQICFGTFYGCCIHKRYIGGAGTDLFIQHDLYVLLRNYTLLAIENFPMLNKPGYMCFQVILIMKGNVQMRGLTCLSEKLTRFIVCCCF